MQYEGQVRLNKKTKNLIKELRSDEVAIIDHIDIDKVSAEHLVSTNVRVVINASESISGKYPNLGPIILCNAGMHIIDNVGEQVFLELTDGDFVRIDEGKLFSGSKLIAQGEVLDPDNIQKKMLEAEEGLSDELERFAANTLEFINKEKDLLIKGVRLPETKIDFVGKHTLIVVRGYEYREDLKTLKTYIREMQPILIGVDGGADAIIESGCKPDIIIGDMDSVTDAALRSGAEIIVHAYTDGKAPGLERIQQLGLSAKTFQAPGMSEDVAMILAYEKGAELIVAVGTHANLIEFLDKGRRGMASTFLARLKVGSRLVDAKGVSKLYRSTVKISYLTILLLAALATTAIVILVSPQIKYFLKLIILNLRLALGF